MTWYGDFASGQRVDMFFTTVNEQGLPTAITSGSAACRKGGTTFLAPAGVTAYTSSGGEHRVSIFTSSAAAYYTTGADYQVFEAKGLITTTSIIGYAIGQFSIDNRGLLRPTGATRTLDVSTGGEAGLDWANIGSPTTAQNLSATNIDVDQIVASVSGAVGSVTGAVGSVTGAVGSVTGNVSGTVIGTTSANVILWQAAAPSALISGRVDANTQALAAGVIASGSFAAGAVDAAAIAANALGAAELAADAVAEIQSGLSTLTAAEVNAEVVDALATDTYAEPGQAAPAATTTLAVKLSYLYKFLRNRVTTTSSQISIYGDDAATVHQKITHSDDGVTYDKGEVASGP